MTRLAGVRVLVVGGASGIGRAVVEASAREGAAVAVVDRDTGALSAMARSAVVRAADATDPGALREATDELVDELGGLDALVHTAGVHDGFATLDSYQPDALSTAAAQLLAVNVTSAVLSVHAALPGLRRSPAASVTLTSSESGYGGSGGGSLYCASNWAVRGLVAALSAELAPAVRVNAVAPGGTTGTGLRRVGAAADVVGGRPGRDEAIRDGTRLKVLIEPSDVAAAFCYLMSPQEARAVTGTVINVDGGRSTA